jgi:D-alanyl-D-alanine carboxypeptidase (penicillin-binding protein 5/6)
MNACAKNLGLQQTVFNNPHGLADKQNKSSALDVSKLAAIALKQELFAKIVATKFHFC